MPTTLPDLAGRPSVRLLWKLPFPTDAAAKAIGRDLWQGAAWARHPVTRVEYVYQLQAQPSSRGGDDVEDTYVHRYRVTGTGLRYEGSMRCSGFGHCQTAHVRNSSVSRARTGFGSALRRTTGPATLRAPSWSGDPPAPRHYQPRIQECAAHPDRAGRCCARRLRRLDDRSLPRLSSSAERYTGFSESALRRHKSRTVRPAPTASLIATRGPGTYQSACATGSHKAAIASGRVYRINGSTDQASVVHEFRAGAGQVRLADRALGRGRPARRHQGCAGRAARDLRGRRSRVRRGPAGSSSASVITRSRGASSHSSPSRRDRRRHRRRCAGAAAVPQAAAQRRAVDWHVNLWTGAIRSGKTIASLLRWLMFVATAPYGGQLVMVGRTRESLARNVFAVLQDPLLFGELTKQVQYTPGAGWGYILGRKVWVFGASDVRAEITLRGMTVAGAYGDEFTLWSEDLWPRCWPHVGDGRAAIRHHQPRQPRPLVQNWGGRPGRIPRLAALPFPTPRQPVATRQQPGICGQDQTRIHRAVLSPVHPGRMGAGRGRHLFDMWDPDRHVIPAQAYRAR